jgi:hypothetical protein
VKKNGIGAYQRAMLRMPLITWNKAAATSAAMLARSIAWATSRAGGHENRRW